MWKILFLVPFFLLSSLATGVGALLPLLDARSVNSKFLHISRLLGNIYYSIWTSGTKWCDMDWRTRGEEELALTARLRSLWSRVWGWGPAAPGWPRRQPFIRRIGVWFAKIIGWWSGVGFDNTPCGQSTGSRCVITVFSGRNSTAETLFESELSERLLWSCWSHVEFFLPSSSITRDSCLLL